MEKNKVPTVIETFAETGESLQVQRSDEPYEYKTAEGDDILVHYWCRWPDYDFIFGIPALHNQHYKLEFGFFQFRKLKDGKVQTGWHIYMDQLELEEMVSGFLRLANISKTMRAEEWEAHENKKSRFAPESEEE